MSVITQPLTLRSPATPPLTIHVDAEHGGIRAVVFASFIAAWLIGYIAADVVLAGDGLNLISVVIGFVVAILISTGIERLLKGRWHSGRRVQVDGDGVRVERRGSLQNQLLSEDPAELLLWRFQVRKRTRIPKGWWVLASALLFEGRYLTTYTFVSPEQLEQFGRKEAFGELLSRKQTASDTRQDLRLAGEQRRLRDAENHRWIDGAEMTFDNFTTYLNAIETQFPEWTPIH